MEIVAVDFARQRTAISLWEERRRRASRPKGARASCAIACRRDGTARTDAYKIPGRYRMPTRVSPVASKSTCPPVHGRLLREHWTDAPGPVGVNSSVEQERAEPVALAATALGSSRAPRCRGSGLRGRERRVCCRV